MMARIELLESGKRRIGEFRAHYPENSAIKSIELQIEYLIEIVTHRENNHSRLKEITIGVLTAREIEPLDQYGSEVFHQIASLAKQL